MRIFVKLQWTKNSKYRIKNEVDKLYGKKMILPDTLKVVDKNQIGLFIDYFSDSIFQVKVVTRINGDCSLCVKDLGRWQREVIKQKDIAKVKFYFFLSVQDYPYFKVNTYPSIEMDYPQIIDRTNKFVSINKLEDTDDNFRTFILNSSNEVVFIGIPLLAEDLKDQFFEEINKALKNL